MWTIRNCLPWTVRLFTAAINISRVKTLPAGEAYDETRRTEERVMGEAPVSLPNPDPGGRKVLSRQDRRFTCLGKFRNDSKVRGETATSEKNRGLHMEEKLPNGSPRRNMKHGTT